MPDTIHVTFRFAIGARVRWGGDPQGAWLIVSRHYHEGPRGGAVDYGLVQVDADKPLATAQAAEPDLGPWEDPPAPRAGAWAWCPHDRVVDVSGAGRVVVGRTATVTRRCLSCGARWEAVYELTGDVWRRRLGEHDPHKETLYA